MISRQQLEQHWAILRKELLGLRHLFATNAQPNGLEYFDETLEANEYELALHALCRSILAAPTPRITDEEIERIYLLHTRMDLIDDCVESIRRKRSISSD